MKLYRICTEATGPYAVHARNIVEATFAGFTVLRGTGNWQYVAEASIIFEIVADDAARELVLHVARTIRAKNAQQAVCVQILDAELVQVTE